MAKRFGSCVLLAVVMFVAGCERNRLYDNTNPFSLYTFLGYKFGPGGLQVINVDSPNLDGTYVVGQTIEITIQFEDVVLVDTSGGTPDLLLATSPLAATALYTGGSGTDTLHFGFTVQTGQNSIDLDYQNWNSLRLNGGAITDLIGTPVSLLLPNPGSGFAGMGSLSVNRDLVLSPGVAPPVVTTVTSPTPNGRYGEGYTVEIRVVYDVAVDLDTSGGTPRIRLNTAPWPAVVPYSSGSGTTTLRFLYTVAAGQSSPDLDQENINALELNGGIISDTVYGTNADIVLPAPGLNATLAELKDIVIDAVPPGHPTWFHTISGIGNLTLVWTNPGDADLAGVRILRKEGSLPDLSDPFDPTADVVCTSCVSPHLDTGLTNGTSYYYAIYSYDDVTNPGPNYATGTAPPGPGVPSGRFIIVGENHNMRRAENPAGSWTIAFFGGTNFNAVAYDGAGAFLAVGDSGTALYSPDGGGTWIDKATGFPDNHLGVVHGNGYWVVVGSGGLVVYTSNIADAFPTWNPVILGSNDLNGVAFGNNTFVTVGHNGDVFRRANDPAGSWATSSFNPVPPGKTFNDVAFGNGEFVAVGSDMAVANEIWYSPDNGNFFHNKTFNSFLRPYYGVCSGPVWWVLVGEDFLDYGPSPIGAAAFQDGGALPLGSGTFRDVVYGNGYYVTVGDGGAVWYAADPTNVGNWTADSEGAVNWRGIAFGD